MHAVVAIISTTDDDMTKKTKNTKPAKRQVPKKAEDMEFGPGGFLDLPKFSGRSIFPFEITESKLTYWVRRGKFPAPFRFSRKSAPLWSLSDLIQFTRQTFDHSPEGERIEAALIARANVGGE